MPKRLPYERTAKEMQWVDVFGSDSLVINFHHLKSQSSVNNKQVVSS